MDKLTLFNLANEEANKCLQCKNPQCMEGCPIHNNIPLIIKNFKDNNYKEALQIIKEKSNLSALCSSVCAYEKQCEGHCILNKKGNGIKFHYIENYLSLYEPLPTEKVNANYKYRVAVVGAGPSGIACGLELAKNGIQVDFYERNSYFGGIPTWGIPDFRLDKNIIKNYYQELIKLGANFNFNHPINQDTLIRLLNDYDDVYLAVGTAKYMKMNIGEDQTNNVYLADQFLEDCNINHRLSFGHNIIVVGGGNCAIDAARCAKRLSKNQNVTILYRRTEKEMPANHAEIVDALNEGINLKTLINPVAFKNSNEQVEVECAIMVLGEPDASGRARPIESNLPHEYLSADSVILCLGSNVDDNFMKSINGLSLSKWNTPIIDEHYETSIKHLYAGGDAVNGATTVVEAMKDGMAAAKSIINKYQ